MMLPAIEREEICNQRRVQTLRYNLPRALPLAPPTTLYLLRNVAGIVPEEGSDWPALLIDCVLLTGVQYRPTVRTIGVQN